MPPACCGPRGLLCRFTILSRSMITVSLSGSTRNTLPVLPRSLPPITITLSFLRICTGKTLLDAVLKHFRRERDDLHELLCPELARHRTEDTRADGLFLVVDQHRRIIVETNISTVGPAQLLGRAHDHSLHHFALFHLAVGNCFLHGDHDDIADRSVLALAAAEYLDALHATRAGVVGHIQCRSHLNHELTLTARKSLKSRRRLLSKLPPPHGPAPKFCSPANACRG